MAQNHFRLTERKGKKCILVNTELCTVNEMQIVQAYIAQGYEAIKRQPRKKSSGKGITKAQIIEVSKEKGYKDILKMIDNKENFMSVLSAFKKAEKENSNKKAETK